MACREDDLADNVKKLVDISWPILHPPPSTSSNDFYVGPDLILTTDLWGPAVAYIIPWQFLPVEALSQISSKHAVPCKDLQRQLHGSLSASHPAHWPWAWHVFGSEFAPHSVGHVCVAKLELAPGAASLRCRGYGWLNR